MKQSIEHFEAEQNAINKKRAKFVATLPEKGQAQYALLDKFIADATKLDIPIYVDAKIPMNFNGKIVLQHYQINNDMNLLVEEDKMGFVSDECTKTLTEVHNGRLLNFMYYIISTMVGNVKNRETDWNTKFQMFIYRAAKVCNSLIQKNQGES